MKIINKDVIQSYIITTARYDFSVYEKRILFRLIEMCQFQLEGKKLDKHFHLERNLFGDYIVSVPISAFLNGEDDEHYARVKQALKDLRNKTIEYEDDKEWKLIGLIEKPKFEKRGVAHFEIQPEIYDAIFNFSKGFRRYELETVMSFNSVYAMRMYELISNQETLKPYSIDKLKLMFKVQDKYTLTADFIRRVIDAAKTELDEKSPYSFTYKTDSQKGSKKITSIQFFPYKTKNVDETLEKSRLEKQVSIGFSLDRSVINYLKENFLFETDEIKHNRDLFEEADKSFDLINLLAGKKRAAHAAKKGPQAYVIGILRGELKKLKEKKEAVVNKEQVQKVNNIAANLANKFKA